MNGSCRGPRLEGLLGWIWGRRNVAQRITVSRSAPRGEPSLSGKIAEGPELATLTLVEGLDCVVPDTVPPFPGRDPLLLRGRRGAEQKTVGIAPRHIVGHGQPEESEHEGGDVEQGSAGDSTLRIEGRAMRDHHPVGGCEMVTGREVPTMV